MQCSFCKPLLDRYLEGTLPARDLLRIASHLENCAPCSTLLEELKAVDGLLATIGTPAPAANFTFAVMAEVRSMPVPVTPRLNVAALLGAYVAGAWAVVALWLRLAHVDVATAFANGGNAVTQFFSAAHGIATGALASFGHGAPLVTTFVIGVLALDLAVAAGLVLVYRTVRPRLAAHLASAREGS